MNIYIDESGSISRKNADRVPFFVIALVHVTDRDGLSRDYKRFVARYLDRMRALDYVRIDNRTGRFIHGGKMFRNGRFMELKGNAFDADMKRAFVEYFTRKRHFELFYIVLDNHAMDAIYSKYTSNTFNYVLQRALRYFCQNKLLPADICHLQLDERNEKIENKHFLENYLNTELLLGRVTNAAFTVQYFDSSRNQFVQIADVLSNLYFSQTQTGAYQEEIDTLRCRGILKAIYTFPDEPIP